MNENPFDTLLKAHQSQSVDQQFGQIFNQIGQYTSGFAKEYTGSAITPNMATQSSKLGVDTGSAFQQLLQKASSVGKQSVDILKGIGSTALGFVKNSGVDIWQKGLLAAKSIAELETGAVGAQTKIYADASRELGQRQDAVMQAYKSGKMSKEDYIKALGDIGKSLQDLSKDNSKIVDSPKPWERAWAIAETATTALSLGSLGLTDVGGAQLLEKGATKGTQQLVSTELRQAIVDQGANRVEQLLMKVPAARQLITRNLTEIAAKEAGLAGETAWQFVQRNSKQLAVDLLIKRPVFYQANMGQAKSLVHNLVEGKYKGAVTDAAWLAVQMFDGGPLGAAKTIGGYVGSGTKKLAYGKESFIDTLSQRFGSKKADQLARYVINSKDPEVEKVLRVAQDVNLHITNKDVQRAVDNFMSTYSHLSPDALDALTPKQIVQDLKNWRDADEIWNTAVKSGKLPLTAKEAARYTPVRWDASTRSSVADAVKHAGDDKAAMLEAVQKVADSPSAGFGNNANLMQNIESIINKAPDAKTAAKDIQAIDAALATTAKVPKFISKQLAAKGFVIAEPIGGRVQNFIETEDLTKLVSGAIKKPETFDPSAAPAPVISHIAGLFKSLGVAPEESNQYAVRSVSRSVADSLNKTVAASEVGLNVAGKDPAMGGNVILSKLQQYVENKRGIRALDKISAGQSSLVDIRQMTLNEISHALETTKNGRTVPLSTEAAKEIRSAVLRGFREVPLDIRGLAEKSVDQLYQYNPLYRSYARAQSALRYTYNPFFRTQETIETKMLSHAQANNLIWMRTRSELDDAAKVLTENRIFSGGQVGEMSSDQVLGKISANLTKGQKRDLAGLALHMADAQGKDLQTLINDNPEQITDALRQIVQYKNHGALASPLARTMNLVFFPMRYNAKVTAVAAEALAKQPPSVQNAVLHSLFTAKDYLKSPEGIRWQSEHADAISLFSWLTPINSIEATLKLLSGGVNSWGDMGQLGGLPFGVISQILDGQGIIKLNRPYVDPKTGSVFPRNIPESAKARAATALVDLLNSMFTYPGRVMGLPGKNQLLKGLVKNFIATNGSDFSSTIDTENLTELQKQWIKVLSGDTSNEAIDKLYQSPADGQFKGYTLPPYTLPFRPSMDASSKYKTPKVPRTLSKGAKKKRVIPGPNPLSLQ